MEKKENYSSMIYAWILILSSSCGIIKNSNHTNYIEHYQVSSTVLKEIVETTIDSCESRILCSEIEYLFLRLEKTTFGYSIEVETIRKPLYKLNSIFQNDSMDIVSFYIGNTLCLTDNKKLLFSDILNDYKSSDDIDLYKVPFEYSCLDIEYKGELYNTLIRFTYSIKSEEIILEDSSIFIDSGDVDISEALKRRGIKE